MQVVNSFLTSTNSSSVPFFTAVWSACNAQTSNSVLDAALDACSDNFAGVNPV